MPTFKDRVFGANVSSEVIETFKKLEGGGLTGISADQLKLIPDDILSERKPTYKGYLGDRTPFARMWTALLVVRPPVPENGKLLIHDELFETIYHVVNDNSDKSYDINEPISDKILSELTENQYLKPKAGITSISSKTEGALGALKRTTVDFVVHNKNDFEDIFLPYFLKPGATVIVDYGWSDSSVNLYSVKDAVTAGDIFLEDLKALHAEMLNRGVNYRATPVLFE